jgi:hypothetical protein
MPPPARQPAPERLPIGQQASLPAEEEVDDDFLHLVGAIARWAERRQRARLSNPPPTQATP